jgi:hypothetical protein
MENKESGAESILGRAQRNVASGWTLHENENGVEVTLKTYEAFALASFFVQLSPSTISNYLAEDGFVSRLVKKKGKTFVVDIEALRKELWGWVFIQDFRKRIIKREKFASGDFMFTGHRTERRHSFAPRGGPQPMAPERISSFTNCIFTCVWANGKNITPPILFTYNSAFRQDRKETEKRSKKLSHLRKCMVKYGISGERIIYVGKGNNETRKYVKESPDLIRRFFDVYPVSPDCTVYSDEGNSFYDDGDSVLLEVGFKKHVRYPAKVHQYLSVNDNPLHGTSKRRWRTCGVDFSDDVDSCLALLSFLDKDIIEHSKKWWDRNMIELTEEGAADLIGQCPGKLSHLHKSWKRSYEEFMNQKNTNNKP